MPAPLTDWEKAKQETDTWPSIDKTMEKAHGALVSLLQDHASNPTVKKIIDAGASLVPKNTAEFAAMATKAVPALAAAGVVMTPGLRALLKEGMGEMAGMLEKKAAPVAESLTAKALEKYVKKEAVPVAKAVDEAAAAVTKKAPAVIKEGFPGLTKAAVPGAAEQSFGKETVDAVKAIKRADALKAFGIKGPPK